MTWQKDEKEKVQPRKQEAHEQLKIARLAEQGKHQAKGKDHHESSTLHHMVSSRSNDKGNLQR